jgi:hypothetical protein
VGRGPDEHEQRLGRRLAPLAGPAVLERHGFEPVIAAQLAHSGEHGSPKHHWASVWMAA